MKKILFLIIVLANLYSFAQTDFFWRNEATNGNWAGSTNWWNGSAAVPAGFGNLIFDNNNRTTMTNDFSPSLNTHAVYFRASATNVRTIGGNPVNFFDNSGADPRIENNSTANHVINFNIVNDADFEDPIQLNPRAGNLTFGGTINTNGTPINVYGNNGHSLFLNGVIFGTGGFTIHENSNAHFDALHTYTGFTVIKAGTVIFRRNNCLVSPFIMDGGTLSTGQTVGYSATVGTLRLRVSSTISLGTGAHTLNFANSSAINWEGSTLTINNWNGLTGRIFVGNNASGLTQAQLDKINFTGYPNGAMILSTGEITPKIPTIPSSVCGTTFLVIPGESISCALVPNATNYRFRFFDQANNEYLVERATGSMTLHLFAELIGGGFQYNQTYSVSAQAFVGSNWTAYGPSCNFSITNDPRTRLRPDFCDTTIPTMDTRIFTNRLPLFNEYTYEVKNQAVPSQIVTFTRTDPQGTGFRLTQEAASILSPGTIYEVRVKAKNGDWETPYWNICTITTPTIPGTIKLRSGSCNVTLTSMTNQAVLSEVVANAVEYQFEVTNTTLNSAPVTFLKSNWVLPMSDLGAGFMTNTTYSIRVRARIGSTFNSYGTPCLVTTPSTIPAPQLTALYCGQTFENYRSLYANRVTNSQEFTFEVTNDQSEETIEVVRPGNFFHLAHHTSPEFLYEGTSFTIRVKVKVNNTYGNYGTPCVVTIGAESFDLLSLENGAASFDKIEAYPNPFNNQFTIKLNDLTSANIQIFDINGRLVENMTTNNTFEIEMGQNLNPGIYLVRVEQNTDRQSFKMIKK